MDYLGFFGLTLEPFSNAPRPKLYFASRQHTEALSRLTYAAHSMKGLALLVGQIGHGKTTLARRMLDSLPEDEYEAAMLVIVHAGITPNWLLKRIAIQLGVEEPAKDKLAILSQLYQRLIEIHQSGKRAVVIIDEAQMLASRDLMEEFRGLLNLEVPGHKLISFIFFGLPEIESNLQLDPPLAQRVALRCRLESFDESETMEYVRHRWNLAGGQPEVFPDDALQEVHFSTRGVPRLTNTLMDNVLLEMFFKQEKVATPERVAEAADNLGYLDPTPEPPSSYAPPEMVVTTPVEDSVVTVTRQDVAGEAQLGQTAADEIAQRVAAEPVEIETEIEVPFDDEPAPGAVSVPQASPAPSFEARSEASPQPDFASRPRIEVDLASELEPEPTEVTVYPEPDLPEHPTMGAPKLPEHARPLPGAVSGESGTPPDIADPLAFMRVPTGPMDVEKARRPVKPIPMERTPTVARVVENRADRPRPAATASKPTSSKRIDLTEIDALIADLNTSKK